MPKIPHSFLWNVTVPVTLAILAAGLFALWVRTRWAAFLAAAAVCALVFLGIDGLTRREEGG